MKNNLINKLGNENPWLPLLMEFTVPLYTPFFIKNALRDKEKRYNSSGREYSKEAKIKDTCLAMLWPSFELEVIKCFTAGYLIYQGIEKFFS
jgi:hypothetical protein